MPGLYLEKTAAAKVAHRLAEESSVMSASVAFLHEHAPEMAPDCAEALRDALAGSKRLEDAVRALQALLR